MKLLFEWVVWCEYYNMRSSTVTRVCRRAHATVWSRWSRDCTVLCSVGGAPVGKEAVQCVQCSRRMLLYFSAWCVVLGAWCVVLVMTADCRSCRLTKCAMVRGQSTISLSEKRKVTLSYYHLGQLTRCEAPSIERSTVGAQLTIDINKVTPAECVFRKETVSVYTNRDPPLHLRRKECIHASEHGTGW